MTDREKAIVMAYTGVCMLSGDKFQIFHKYIEEIMGRPVYTHEMGIKAIVDEIKSRSNADFIALCAEQEPKTGHWKRISMDKYSEHAQYWYRCDRCGEDNLGNTDWCPSCGARMAESEEV